MALDIDRLHDVVEQIFSNDTVPRTAGKTTATVYLMLGNVWIGENPGSYIYIGHTRVACDIAKMMFITSLQKDGYKLEVSQHDVVVNGTQVFHFRSKDVLNVQDHKGSSIHNIFIDVNWDDMDVAAYRKLYNTLREFEPMVVKHDIS
jgi:hypothetical protein